MRSEVMFSLTITNSFSFSDVPQHSTTVFNTEKYEQRPTNVTSMLQGTTRQLLALVCPGRGDIRAKRMWRAVYGDDVASLLSR